MHHTLKDWAIAFVNDPCNEALQSGMSDWISEQGWHNFDVGDEIWAIVDLHRHFNFSWVDNCKNKYGQYIPTILGGDVVSIGSKKICLIHYLVKERTVFWPKFMCFNDQKITQQFRTHMIDYLNQLKKEKNE